VNRRRESVPPVASSISKRLIDVIGASVGLVLLSPLLVGVAILVRWRLGAPVLFRQTRAGLNAVPFRIIKFRTMTDQRDEEGHLLPDELRLPRFGQFLRSSSIDELPELVNVLKGEMSLVGPRPLISDYVPRYSVRQARRLTAKPGITGLAQVRGRNALSWGDRFELDVEYIERWSVWLDFRIVVDTVMVVLSRRGVSTEGYATAPEFTSANPDDSE